MRHWAKHKDTPQHLSALLIEAANQIDDLERRNEALSETMTNLVEGVKKALRDGTADVVKIGAVQFNGPPKGQP